MIFTAKNKTLEELEIRWNHLRTDGAVGIARGLQVNINNANC